MVSTPFCRLALIWSILAFSEKFAKTCFIIFHIILTLFSPKEKKTSRFQKPSKTKSTEINNGTSESTVLEKASKKNMVPIEINCWIIHCCLNEIRENSTVKLNQNVRNLPARTARPGSDGQWRRQRTVTSRRRSVGAFSILFFF